MQGNIPVFHPTTIVELFIMPHNNTSLIIQNMNISILFIFLYYISLIHAQQPYAAKSTTDCDNKDNTKSQFGYTCNGLKTTCQSYLTFRSLPPYNTVSSISTLLGSNASELATINSVTENSVFEIDKLVIVPVTCSCSGKYYQYNTTYVVQKLDTYLLIANNTYQGLSTCQALIEQNNNLTTRDLYVGTRLVIPLRCACPTKNQTDEGLNYLLSFLVTWGQYVNVISLMFGADMGRTLEANSLTEDNAVINPFTTLLIPLQTSPTILQTLAPPPPPSSSSPPPPAASTPLSSSNKTWVYALIGVLGGGGFVSVAGIIFFCVYLRRTKEKKPDPGFKSENFEAIDKSSYDHKLDMDSREFMDNLSDIGKSLKVYTFEELKKATDDFSHSSWIRGSVYRGNIKGDFAAIKKMNGDVSEEINVLSKISHFNLIRLSGVCFNEGTWYLVYEYAVNGPLSRCISSNGDDDMFLSFSQRIQISLDVATGLNYIHNYTSPPYIHKDIKSSNVLIDGEFRAKITNFGLARSAGGKEGEFALTRHIVGTKGYMAPEYLENGLVSTKLDVYAFGVLMLELITGKEVSLLYNQVNTHLTEVLDPVINDENGKEKLRDLMDSSLQGNYPEEIAMFVARLIESCMKKDPSARPGMGELQQSLSRIFTSSLN